MQKKIFTLLCCVMIAVTMVLCPIEASAATLLNQPADDIAPEPEATVEEVQPTPAPTPARPLNLPVITKHPGGEVVDAGRGCAFVAKANNFDTISWYFTNGSEVVRAEDASGKFSGLGITDADKIKIKLKNVPASLNGWQVGAEFTNSDGTVKTDTCTITVKGGTAATATPAPTPVPTETPAPEVTEAPAAEIEAPAGTAAPAPAVPAPVQTAKPQKADSSDHTLIVVLGMAAAAAAICAASVAYIIIEKRKY